MSLILISHRGNISGPLAAFENSPQYVLKAIDLGYDVEIDVWNLGDKWYLGHDSPQYLVDLEFLENPKLWCHAKNIDALSRMISNKNIRCFWHQEDDVTLTSDNYLWTYPGKIQGTKSICVMPEKFNIKIGDKIISKCAGICSDFIEEFKKE